MAAQEPARHWWDRKSRTYQCVLCDAKFTVPPNFTPDEEEALKDRHFDFHVRQLVADAEAITVAAAKRWS